MKIIKRFKFAYMFLSFLLVLTCGYNAANATVAPSKIGGVNFGGVFTLEDWFFSDKADGHDVMTTCADSKTGIASSQLFTGDTSKPEFKWTSETDLIQKLHSKDKLESPAIVAFFKKHRETYLSDGASDPNLSTSFAKAAAMGIKIVRLPITWAIQYDKPYTIVKADGKIQEIPATNGNIELIQDPFYPNKHWASIPIGQIKAILEAAENNGIRVILDIHALPGGASDGTYNGVWPDAPRFWSVTPAIYQKNFSTIFDNLVDWANSLPKDSDAFKGLEGLTPMNEPAHMMGSVMSTHVESLKSNPDPKEIKVCSAAGTPISPPDGKSGITSWAESPYNSNILSPKDILNTLGLAVTKFRMSKLGTYGVKLYMNVIETMYDSSTPKPFEEIGRWWRGDAKTGADAITSPDERMKWAVLDIHHYVAWGEGCNDAMTTKLLDYTPTGDIKWKDPGTWKDPVYVKDTSGNFVLRYVMKNSDGTHKIINDDTLNQTYKKANGTLLTINRNGFYQIKECSKWFSTIRGELELTTEDKLAASEFSAGTNADTLQSGSSGKGTIVPTNWDKYRNTFLEEQIKLANEAKISAMFWTWAIPYNSNYQNEWAFSNICSGTNKALLPGICSAQ